MSGRDWKPGDVGVTAGQMEPPIRFLVGSDGRARYADGDTGPGAADSARPLVVIDPEDREQVERLAGAYIDEGVTLLPWHVTHMQHALRSLLVPSKPVEPTGLGAVVEDKSGHIWVRSQWDYSYPWSPAENERLDSAGGDRGVRWDEIPAVRVLSEGVQP